MERILIIDDDNDIRCLLRDALEWVGYEVIEAADGYDGLRLYRVAPTPLIVTDVMMPGQDGLEVLRELRRDFPEVKIIVISAAGQSVLDLARLFGAHCTISKPFTMPVFLDAVHTVMLTISRA
jgi:CheY-like chemotaxis protein